MRNLSMALTFLLLVPIGNAAGQSKMPATRLEKQHQPTPFMRHHLKEAEQSIMEVLNARLVGGELQTLQTIRDLEQLFPDYPFTKLLLPLETILKDEKSDPMSRMLAALALDELHSDAGDLVIKDLAETCEHLGIKILCQALLAKSNRDNF